MKILLFPIRLIGRFLSLTEKALYKVRDTLWDYPDLFLEENNVRDNVSRVYMSSVPYSHFFLATIVMIIVSIVFFIGANSDINGSKNAVLLEGVVIGTDSNGNTQQLSKINPIFPANIQLEKDLVDLIYEPLLRFNYVPFEGDKKIGGVEYILAKDITTIVPGADYIFELRENVYWHDNKLGVRESLFTADDVIATLNLLDSLNIDIASSRAVKQLRWEKINDHSIRICTIVEGKRDVPCSQTTDKPIFSNFLEILTFKVLPAHKISDIDNSNVNTFEPELYRSPVGTGKYKFANASSTEISVRKNEIYYVDNIIHNNYQLLEDYYTNRKDIAKERHVYEIFDLILDTFEQVSTKEDITKKFEIYTFDHKLTISLQRTENEIFIDEVTLDDKENVDQIKFIYFKDLDSAISALKNAEIHSLATTSVKYRNDLREYTQIQSVVSPVLYNQFWALYFNLRTKPDGTGIGPDFLLDQNVRKALSYGIDTQSIIENSLNGIGARSFGPIPQISYYFNSNASWSSFDRSKAENLLDEAGWKISEGNFYRTNSEGEIMSFNLSFVESNDRLQIARAIQSDLSKLGVEVFISRDLIDLPDFYKDIDIRKAISKYIFDNGNISDLKEKYPSEIENIALTNFMIEQSILFNNTESNVSLLLDQEGWKKRSDDFRYKDDIRMQLVLVIEDTAINREITETFKDELLKIGIEVRIIYSNNQNHLGWELQAMNDQLLAPRLFDTILYGMDRFVDPEMYELYHSSQSSDPGLNISSFKSKEITVDKRPDRQEGESSLVQVPKVDKFLEQARSFDPVNSREERKEKYDDIQRILSEEVPAIYLYHPQFLYFANNQVNNINLEGAKSIEERFLNIQQWEIE